MSKQGFFKPYEYVYDKYFNCYICPNNVPLKYSTTNRDGYREYKSDQIFARIANTEINALIQKI